MLVNGHHDPLLGRCDIVETLGFIESWPANPREAVVRELPRDGLRGLVRTVDIEARRHRIGVGAFPSGDPVGELGAVLVEPIGGSIPIWVDDGTLYTEEGLAGAQRASAKVAARWVLAPGKWPGLAHLPARARAVGRRALLARIRTGMPAQPSPVAEPAGWLLPEETADTVPLHVARHPVTGDQLVTNLALEAQDMGYVDTRLIGHLHAEAPLTGVQGLRPVAVPWASKFGLKARRR